MQKHRLLVLSASVIVAGLFHSGTVRAESEAESAASDSRAAALISVGVGVGQPRLGGFVAAEVNAVEGLYLGAMGSAAVGDHAAMFAGARAQYRFALPSDLYVGVHAGVGWLNGENMSGDGAYWAFADGIKPSFGATFAYQPSWFMVGLDAFGIPATEERRPPSTAEPREKLREEGSIYAQASAFVGVAF